MDGIEGLKPGTGIETTRPDPDVAARLAKLRKEHLEGADEVLDDLESGRFKEEDEALVMEEAA